MDFEAIKKLAARYLNNRHIKFTIGKDQQWSRNKWVQKHLAVSFHTDNGRHITITQPHMCQMSRGQVKEDGTISTGFNVLEFNRDNIDAVFQKAFGGFIDKPYPMRAGDTQAMYEIMTKDAVAAEGEEVDALVEKVMRFGTKMRHEDAVSMLKKALIERVQTSRQWLQ